MSEFIRETKNIHVPIPITTREMVGPGTPKEYCYILPVTESLEYVLPSLEPVKELPMGIFLRKKELHVTLLGFGTRDLIRQKIKEGQMRGIDVRTAINTLLSTINFSFEVALGSTQLVHNLQYSPEAIRTGQGRAAFESEYTIIISLEMPGLHEFVQRMRDELGIEIGRAEAHVTLYIKDNGEVSGLGIGLYNIEKQVAGLMEPYITVEPIRW